MGSMIDGNNETALVPIAEAMPELRAEQYAKVREWDAARMSLEGEYEAADGEYLIKIRDALKPRRGLWQAYLAARGIPYQTALDRIHKAEGHTVTPIKNTKSVFLNEPAPAFEPVAKWPMMDVGQQSKSAPEPPQETILVPRDELHRLESIERRWEQREIMANEEPPQFDMPPAPTVAPGRPLPVVPAQPLTIFSVEQWEALSGSKRAQVISEGRANARSSLNAQSSDSIEWALWSWNPVTGCLHNCPYCYARDIANHYTNAFPRGFAPTFQPQRLGAPAAQKVPPQAETELGHRNIFTCSMADLFGKWVPAGWIEAVLDTVRANPQWNFLLLTKFPNRLAEFEFPDNAWLGTSVDCQARVKNAERSFAKVRGGVKWLSIEPMLEPIKFTSLDMFNWVVIGGASRSTETPEWIPPRRWVLDLECQARDAGCMIYEKTNLGIQGPSRLREYPGWQRGEQRLPDALAYLPTIGQEEGGAS